MKKLVLLISVVMLQFNVLAQQAETVTENQVETQAESVEFPYGKMLNMSHDELIEAKFKYDAKKNQYILTKLNGLNQANAILGALAGAPQNYIPHVDDYVVTIQRGKEKVSFINVTFYNDQLYHKILTFAVDNGENLLETSSQTLNKAIFNYAGYAFDLQYKVVGQASAVSGKGKAVSRDDSYNSYSFLISTGVEPDSIWHTKEAAKAAKRDMQGKKKQSAADLM